MNIPRRWLTFLVASLLATLLTACDGGIFGTGDGGGTVPPIPEPVGGGGEATDNGDDGGGGDTGADGGNGGGAETGDPMDTGADMQMPTPDESPQTGADVSPIIDGDRVVVGFTNMLSGDSDALPRVRLVNTTDVTLRLEWDDGNSLQTVASVAGNEASDAIEIPLSATAMSLIEPGTTDTRDIERTRIEPLVLSSGSLSLLIARRLSDDEATTMTALASRAQGDDPMLALVRIVPGVTLAENADESSAFSLNPAGASPGAATVRFPEISAANPSAEYVVVPAGDYQLSGDDGHLATRALSIAPGAVYTVIVTSRDSVTIVIEND